jgi:hypothetical protein
LLQVHNEDNYVVQFDWHQEWKFAIFQVEFTHDIWIKKWWERLLVPHFSIWGHTSLKNRLFFTFVFSKVATRVGLVSTYFDTSWYWYWHLKFFLIPVWYCYWLFGFFWYQPGTGIRLNTDFWAGTWQVYMPGI